MIKNVTGQKVAVFAWDNNLGSPKTGDAANITGQISLDGGTSVATNDTTPTELDATNQPGVYVFDLTPAETNADMVVLTPKSTTAGVVFRPLIAYPTNLTSAKAGCLDAAVSTRSTLTAQGVWEYATRTLTSFGTLIADLWAHATRTLTAGTRDAKIDAIKLKTDNLPADPADQSQVEAAMAAAVAPLALEANSQGHAAAALAAYDPPTRTEAAGDRDAILAAVAGLNDITVGDLLAGDLSDQVSFPANSLADLVRKLFWIVVNRVVIDDVSGNFTAYKTNGVTPAAHGRVTDNGGATERSQPTWL